MIYTIVSARRAGRGRGPVPADLPPQKKVQASSQRRPKGPRKPAREGPLGRSEGRSGEERGQPLFYPKLFQARRGPWQRPWKGVVTSKEKERLPRIPPPRRRKTRMNRGRKSEDIVKGMLTAVSYTHLTLPTILLV